MGDSNMEAASVSNDLIRTFFSILDRPAYWLLGLVYQLFFNVASADLFNNATIMAFYKRVQLIIGVFMMFQLAITILKGIMEPDSFTDSKTGAGNLIKRVAISLMMLTVLVPISIPGARNEWERQLNNNGLLFGALYSLQHRVLNNNTLGRLILGTDDTAESFTSSDLNDKDSSLAKSSRIFTSTILKGFYRINLIPEEERTHIDGRDDATINENRVCKDIDDEVMAAYTRLDADPGEIIALINASCEYESNSNLWNSIRENYKKLVGKTYYVFAYMPLVSAIVAFIFVFILLNFTIEVAVRAVKLSVLRIIAPIPIISYMDPKGSKDNSFNSWVKTLTSTYLDLFIRLATVYFVLFLVQDMIVNGIYINNSTGILGTLSFILILVGLFVFAKQAPKFIKQVLGVKDDGGKLFGGFGDLAGALGVGAAAIGAVGSGIASAKASKMADETRKSFGEAVNPNAMHNRAKHLLAGIAGGAMGFGTGVSTAFTAKDHALKNTFENMQKRNTQTLTAGDSGSTLFGRASANATRLFTGDGPGASVSRDISSMESRKKALEAIKSRASGEMVKQLWTKSSFSKVQSYDVHGRAIGNVNYKSFIAAKKAAEAAGQSTVTFQDADDSTISYTVDMTTANMNEGWILKGNESSYISEVAAGHQDDAVLSSLIDDAEKKGGTYTVDPATGKLVDTHGKVVDRDSVTKTADELEMAITEAKRSNIINEQNDRYSSKK